jgi:hypothetical protein
MKRSITDKQAAELYLEHWQIIEGGQDDPERVKEISQELVDAGYPDPEDIVFDNEAEPLIEWTNPKFNWAKWIEKNSQTY